MSRQLRKKKDRKKVTEVHAPAEIRESQLLSTFGPGAMVDLPHHSVVIGGLDYWRHQKREVEEPRLLALLQKLKPGCRVYLPPTVESEDDRADMGIRSFEFPAWFLAELEEDQQPPPRHGRSRKRRRLVPKSRLEKRKLVVGNRKLEVSPVRFVQGCVLGHLSDIDWYGYAHRDFNTPCRRQLWLEEQGTSGDLAELYVVCACGARRTLKDATHKEGRSVLGYCDGRLPWLGPRAFDPCENDQGERERNRLLIRTASDGYFPHVLSLIHIPETEDPLKEAVGRKWENLKVIPSLDFLKMALQMPDIGKHFEGMPAEPIYAEIQRRQAGPEEASSTQTIKEAEFLTLNGITDTLGSPAYGSDFFAEAFPIDRSRPLLKPMSRVVLLPKLKEARALLGFTRFEADNPDQEGELDLEVKRAPLSRHENWFPGIENRGEGFFIGFDGHALARWRSRDAVKEREASLKHGHTLWQQSVKKNTAPFPRVTYYLLHSLSHLLITAISLECGYPASAIRERIYAGPYGAGILLYTASTDAEGTMGGLVQVGHQLEHHLHAALELARLCANDPICSEHDPSRDPARRYLHGAACHGCMFIGEPSCEQRNDFLDRSLVIGSVAQLGAELYTPGLLDS